VPKTIHDAIAHHQQGRLREAESIYLDLLLKQPNDVDALHYLGVLRMRQGRRDEAIDFVKRALRLAPRNADAWNNLGNMLLAANDEKAAELAYTNTTNLKPDNAEAWYNLANLLRRQRRRDEAVRCYRRVLDLNPKFAGAYENIALLFLRIGRPDLTADVYRRWLAVEPDNPIARHMAAAYSDANAPTRAEDEYVAKIFDRFADTFDEALAKLHYAAPGLLTAALTEVIPFTERRLAVLDAGCGTGLCGPLLRSSARQLIGVDLSAGMLAKARERNVYDELHVSELVAFMRAHPREYDVVISADTLVYFGALEDAMSAAARRAQARRCAGLHRRGRARRFLREIPAAPERPVLTLIGLRARVPRSGWLRGIADRSCRAAKGRRPRRARIRRPCENGVRPRFLGIGA
jgi:predicted TPR repeat methyltransferase